MKVMLSPTNITQGRIIKTKSRLNPKSNIKTSWLTLDNKSANFTTNT